MHSEHHEVATTPSGGFQLPQIIGIFCWFLAFTCLFLWVKYDLLSGKSSSEKWWDISIEDLINGAPKLGQPADYEVIMTHELKPGEVWATEIPKGNIQITSEHVFEVKFEDCNNFTEFRVGSEFPECAKAGPALIKMGKDEKRSFLIQIIRKK